MSSERSLRDSHSTFKAVRTCRRHRKLQYVSGWRRPLPVRSGSSTSHHGGETAGDETRHRAGIRSSLSCVYTIQPVVQPVVQPRAGVRQLAALFIVFKGGSSIGVRGFVPRKIFEIVVCCRWVLEHFSTWWCNVFQTSDSLTVNDEDSLKSSESEESRRRSDSEE